MSFFWYDYETFGSRVAVDRPVQFAGVRTDETLQPMGEPVVLYCRPAPDYLPRPAACLIHGITPTELLERGISESEFARRIYEELSQPNTCAVGYNATRFDHEVTRYLLYRNLHDPYGWHWRDGNSKWDLIDLLRAAYALRPDGIEWPVREDGGPSFRLEDLAVANGLEHESPHEALADVETTIELARLVREKQPRLFDYYLGLRDRREVARHVAAPFLWVSSLVEAARGCAALLAPVAEHPTLSNAIIAYDLRHDPSGIVDRSPDELRASLFSSSDDRPPLYAIKTNACPFVAPVRLLDEGVRRRLGLDEEVLTSNYRALRASRTFGERVRAAYDRPFAGDEEDVDTALYAGFMPDGDREMLDHMLAAGGTLEDASEVVFEDGRLSELIFRYRARNFPDALSGLEKARWRSHCRRRHLGPDADGDTHMDAFEAEIRALRAQHAGSRRITELLDDLEAYGRRLRRWLREDEARADAPSVR